jgi:hypothetical protein
MIRAMILLKCILSALLLVLLLPVGVSAPQGLRMGVKQTQTNQSFDGNWWSKTSTDEHSGFINGAADCLTWTAHETGFNATPEQLTDKVTKFYEENPGLKELPVIDVWRKIWEKMTTNAASPQPGETWKNPHWYLDGFWWLEESPEQKQGYIEGYLWCLRTRVPEQSQKYPRSVSFYVDRIDGFTKTNASSEADREKVALILARFQNAAPK